MLTSFKSSKRSERFRVFLMKQNALPSIRLNKKSISWWLYLMNVLWELFYDFQKIISFVENNIFLEEKMAGLVEDIWIILLGNKNGDIITLFKYLEGLYMDDLFYLVWLHKQTWDQWGKVVVRKNGLICHPSDGESVITPSCFRKLWVLCHWKYSEVRQPLSCWKCRWLLVLGSGCWTIAL